MSDGRRNIQLWKRPWSMVLRVLDSRWYSRLRAAFWIGTAGVGLVALAVGAVLALIKSLSHVGVVSLVFIGIGLFLLALSAAGRVKRLVTDRPANQELVAQTHALRSALADDGQRLAEDILRFVAERQRYEPPIGRQGDWATLQAEDDQYRKETRARFTEQFVARIASFDHQARTVGAAPSWEFPGEYTHLAGANPMGEIAQKLIESVTRLRGAGGQV